MNLEILQCVWATLLSAAEQILHKLNPASSDPVLRLTMNNECIAGVNASVWRRNYRSGYSIHVHTCMMHDCCKRMLMTAALMQIRKHD